MTTVTSLTADRMLAIEAASVVDGDVVGDNLILTKHDGTQINAGSVRGPKGDPGPVGSDLAILSAIPVLDVGIINQIRAGRQFTAADFTNMGLNAPAGLWNLSDLTDVSGNGRNLSNKGAVGFASGINGGANTAAQFTGAPGQALYIPDSGAADSLRLRNGTMGCWFRTAKRATINMLIDKYAAVPNQDYSLFVNATNQAQFNGSPDGSANTINLLGISDVADDRWHFAVATFDGTVARLYVDGILEGSIAQSNISMNPGPSVFNIGGRGADASNNNAFPCFGRIDEAFVTQDVLNEEQIRNLYCAKIAHTLTVTPSRVTLSIRRRRKGPVFAVADFSVQPLRLHNFSGGSLGDEGSNGVNLTNNGQVFPTSAVDGTPGNAMMFYAATPTSLSATDAGLPAALASRSWGCWFKTSPQYSTAMTLLACGTTNQALIHIAAGGILTSLSGGDQISGPVVNDGEWHFVVAVEYNAVGGTTDDGIKRKLYLDGKLVGISTVLNSLTLAGANRFRIGIQSDGVSTPFTGMMDSVFISGAVLTADDIHKLYAKGTQALAPSPKNVGDHIEAMDSNNVFAIFDTVDTTAQVDLKVAS